MNKIMVVDDEKNSRELLTEIMELEGYEVFACGSGKECLDKLKEGYIPDLLILDMRMPEMSGSQVVCHIREDLKKTDLKIIILTASQNANSELMEKYSILDFLFKPYDNDVLVQKVKSYLA